MFRCTQYKPVAHVDTNFTRFLTDNNMPIALSHGWAHASVEAELPSVAKYAKQQRMPTTDLDITAAGIAEEYLWKHFAPCMAGSQESPTELVWEDMNKTTACGTPWNYRFYNKVSGMAGGLKVYSEKWYNDLGQKPVNEPIWTSAVKEEVLPIEKVNDGRRRTFTGSPIELTYATNKLCLDMNNRMFAAGAKGRVWSSVGMTMFSGGWDHLGRRLSDGTKAGWEFDARQYDSSLGQYLFKMVFRFRKRCLPRELWAKLAMVYQFIIFSVVCLTDGSLVRKTTGNPSGSGNTTPDNTLILFWMWAFAYIRTCLKKGRKPTYEEFMTWKGALYGDDSVIMVPETHLSWMTGIDIVEAFDIFGLTLEGNLEPRPLTDLSFLSQGFKFEERYKQWVPIPSAAKVLSSMLYGSKTDHKGMSLYRAHALYLMSYWNKAAREVLGSYITWITRRGGICDVPDSPITAVIVASIVRSDDEIERMWLGQESSVQSLKEVTCMDTFLNFLDHAQQNDYSPQTSAENASCYAPSESAWSWLI